MARLLSDTTVACRVEAVSANRKILSANVYFQLKKDA